MISAEPVKTKRTMLAVAFSSLLVGAVALACVWFTVRAKTDSRPGPKGSVVSTEAVWNRFPPSTEAERALEKVLRGADQNIDLALVNWLVAADIPEFQDLTREEFFRQLDALTDQVRQEMARMQPVARSRGEDVQSARTRCGIFCNAIIKLGFAYTEQFRQEQVTPALLKALHADANHISLAGLLRTRRGSCVSMPLIYLVLGQRLGMPVHLVAVGRHYFVRWEEPGFRLNIEPTIVDRVSVTPDDGVYLEIEGLTRAQLRGSDLRNLARREVVGHLLFARSGYWATKGPAYRDRHCGDLDRARQLAPDDAGICESQEAVFKHYGLESGTVVADAKSYPERTRVDTNAVTSTSRR